MGFCGEPTFVSHGRWRQSLQLSARGVICVRRVNTEVEAAGETQRRARHSNSESPTCGSETGFPPPQFPPAAHPLTCTGLRGTSRWVWIQPCCDSSCPPGRGSLWEKRSPEQSGPLRTCSSHTRVASKPGNTPIARLAPPTSAAPATEPVTQP